MHQSVIEDRATVPDDTGRGSDFAGHLYFMEGGRVSSHDPHIDERTALTYTAVWACRRVISQTLASLGWHVFERSQDGRTKKPIEDDIAWMLGMQANPEMNAFEWRQLMVNDALSGNGYSEIERTGGGRPSWLWRICPSRVRLLRDENGRLLYEIRNPGSESTYLLPENVFHLRGPSPDGLVGYSVVEMFRRSIGLGVATERYGRTFYDRGPMPGGVLKLPATLKKEAKDEVQASFERAYGGSQNAGKVMVLTGQMDFAPMSLSQQDAQFIMARGYNVYDIARIYGVPPHKIAQLDHATFSNIESQSIEFVQDCVLPWVRRLEMEADVKLYGRTMRGRRYTRLNLGTLLRGDSIAQSTAIREKVNAGLMTPNEGREYFDLDPMEGGDTLLVQGAMTTLDRVINPPEPPAPVAPPKMPQEGGQGTNGGDSGQRPTSGQDGASAAIVPAFRDLFAEVYGRQLKVEADKATRADNQGQLLAWAVVFYGSDLEDRVAASIAPVVAALLAAVGGKPEEAGALAARLAHDHAMTSLADLKGGRRVVDGWQGGRLAAQARKHVEMVMEAVR